MPTEKRLLKVFLCHASQDKPIVRELYQRLRAEDWIDPWLDEEKLLPGQDWDMEIEKAVEAADAVIVCLSNSSINKEGYLQKELRKIMNKALEKPKGAIFIIPLRLDECKLPTLLLTWQYQDYFPEENRGKVFLRLLKSLQLRASDLSIPAKLSSSIPSTTNTFGGLEFVNIPAGTFIMGSPDKDEDVSPFEKPQREINIPYDCWIARFPVTNSQYANFAKANELSFKIPKDKNSHPLVYVSWYDALDYLGWFNKIFKKELPAGYSVSLPSEAEWEKAARGRDGRLYPWGDRFNILHPLDSKFDQLGKDMCNIDESVKGDTTPVNFYTPFGDSPYGVSDMAGNVWEWTRSMWSNNNNIREVSEPDYKYPYNPDDGREDESIKGIRVLRGGSHLNSRWHARCASRGWDIAEARYRYAGFRLAIVPLNRKK